MSLSIFFGQGRGDAFIFFVCGLLREWGTLHGEGWNHLQYMDLLSVCFHRDYLPCGIFNRRSLMDLSVNIALIMVV
jgi:hypothetical protein